VIGHGDRIIPLRALRISTCVADGLNHPARSVLSGQQTSKLRIWAASFRLARSIGSDHVPKADFPGEVMAVAVASHEGVDAQRLWIGTDERPSVQPGADEAKGDRGGGPSEVAAGVDSNEPH
jgi:hypothetical protein